MTFTLRAATPEDEPAIDALTAASPDGGAVTFRPVRHVAGADRASAAERRLGVVAEVPGAGIVGSARVSFSERFFAGELRPHALLGSLVVHPEHRRQGIAAALAGWRIDRAREHAPDGVLLAVIQHGNVASEANASRWSRDRTPPLVIAPVPMRSRSPHQSPALRFEEAGATDAEELAEGLRRFAARPDFGHDWTPERITGWLTDSPIDSPVNHWLVARERSGRIVAGLGLREEGRLLSLQVVRMSAALRMANRLLRVVPADGMMRNLTVSTPWFAPGRLDAARALWQHARWDWRDRGSSLVAQLDARSPALDILRLKPWSVMTRVHIAYRAPVEREHDRLIDYP